MYVDFQFQSASLPMQWNGNVSVWKGESVSRLFYVIIKFDLDLSVFANSNSEESKWMAAATCSLSLLYGGGGGGG